MNKILKLKGKLNPVKYNGSFGKPNIRANDSISISHMKDIAKQLIGVKEKWEKDNLIDGALVSVHYDRVVAKSNRIGSLLLNNSKSKEALSAIRGSRFDKQESGEIKHVFTYYISLEQLSLSIDNLQNSINELSKMYSSKIRYEDIDLMDDYKLRQIIKDCYYVERIQVDENKEKYNNPTLLTLYKTKRKNIDILNQIGIDITEESIIDDSTLTLNPKQINILQNKAPYLIAMSVKDFNTFSNEKYGKKYNQIIFPKPGNEPTIGVIDTHFDDTVSFKDWVQYYNCLKDDGYSITEQDKVHGTEVCSIIVNGPAFNKELDDGCGLFRARLFGVSRSKGYSWFQIYKKIETIVKNNLDIKVWNLSLGSDDEIEENFISPIGALLDRLQNEYDIVFIVSGTNIPDEHPDKLKIGVPADSLNSIVVNSVKRNNKSASYTRKGPVLSFFHKPDVSYYGGDEFEYIQVGSPMGLRQAYGTSFAAPWISRKMAFMIHIMGMKREEAKAVLIDSAAKWQTDNKEIDSIGFGVVPIHIKDVLSCEDDEIKFIISGVAEDYELRTYNIPVPLKNNKYYYHAKATLCYFPKCDRNQGVDYTTGEMSIKVGRIKDKIFKRKIKGKEEVLTKLSIDDIANNVQDDESAGTEEKKARDIFRKWDNIKHINTGISSRAKAKKSYGYNKWGLSIITKDRVQIGDNRGVPFSVVITLKEMERENRIKEFVDLCKVNDWIVNELDVEKYIDIRNKAQEDVHFDK